MSRVCATIRENHFAATDRVRTATAGADAPAVAHRLAVVLRDSAHCNAGGHDCGDRHLFTRSRAEKTVTDRERHHDVRDRPMGFAAHRLADRRGRCELPDRAVGRRRPARRIPAKPDCGGRLSRYRFGRRAKTERGPRPAERPAMGRRDRVDPPDRRTARRTARGRRAGALHHRRSVLQHPAVIHAVRRVEDAARATRPAGTPLVRGGPRDAR
jgi:hypothetical protein